MIIKYDHVLFSEYQKADRDYQQAVSEGSPDDIRSARTVLDEASRAMKTEHEIRTAPPPTPQSLARGERAYNARIKALSEPSTPAAESSAPLPPNRQTVHTARLMAPGIKEMLIKTVMPINERLTAVEEALADVLEKLGLHIK